MLALTGCASKLAQPNQYSGFLKDYSNLKETTTASGKPELRWIDPTSIRPTMTISFITR
jgi:hypothetical protein